LVNALKRDFGERGVEIVHIVMNDGDGDGDVDGDDAAMWQSGYDHDGDGNVDTLNIPVLADTDDGLWNHYKQDCSELGLPCLFSCNVTPQHQIMDRGMITVDDKCSVPEGGSQCQECGYDDADVRAVLDELLPPKWCGEARP
jgi:hypothetical protein